MVDVCVYVLVVVCVHVLVVGVCVLVAGNASIIDFLLYAITAGKITVHLARGRQYVDGLDPWPAPNKEDAPPCSLQEKPMSAIPSSCQHM